LKSHDLSNIFLPHPNPPLGKVRELDFPVSPIYKGGLRGGKKSLTEEGNREQGTGNREQGTGNR
jgi:hypothetical protein